LVGLELTHPPERWEALGFAVDDGAIELGGVRVALGAGEVRWAVRGLSPTDDIDRLPTTSAAPAAASDSQHPNGAIGIDHVVVTAPDFDRTARALDAAGMPLRRIRDAGGFRQGFRRLAPAILELVEARSAGAAEGGGRGPRRRAGALLGPRDYRRRPRLASQPDTEECFGADAARLGEIRPAVQPGRQIATLKGDTGLGLAVAFMTPEPASEER
jgi:hypothetical protein